MIVALTLERILHEMRNHVLTETEIESEKDPRSLKPSETQLIWLSNPKRDFVWYVVAVGYAINKRKI